MISDTERMNLLGDYIKILANATEPEIAFQAASDIARDLIGHQLFTIMAFDAETMEVKRCFTSNPKAYPTGGQKPKRDTAWGRHVLTDGKYFIGYNADDIRENFDDYEVIKGLGLNSVLNVPIRCLGRTVGTMNLLDQAGFYSETHVETAEIIASNLVGVLATR
jgi:GAF domain-containing protein